MDRFVLLSLPLRAVRAYRGLLRDIRTARRDRRCLFCGAPADSGGLCGEHRWEERSAP